MKTKCIDLSSKKYKVYFYTINGKTYYGLTSRPLTKRHAEHLKEVKSGTGKTKFYKAWRNLEDPNSVQVQLLRKELSPVQAGLLESYMIFKDKTLTLGYNSTPGGEFGDENQHIKFFATCDEVQDIWGDDAFYYYDIFKLKNLDVQRKVKKAKKGEVIKIPPQIRSIRVKVKKKKNWPPPKTWEIYTKNNGKLKIREYQPYTKDNGRLRITGFTKRRDAAKELKRQRKLKGQNKLAVKMERRKQKKARQIRFTERDSLCEKYQWNKQTYAAVQKAPAYIQEKLKGFYEQAKDPALANKDAIRTPIWEKYYNLLHNIQDTY